jgi:tetratricopeptide (TPR) repeat protein
MVRTKLGRYAAGIMALAVTLALAATAAAQVGTVKGKVMDAQGNPVEGATVSIVQKGSKSGRTLKTNKKGEFVQVGIFPANYVITAEKDNEKANAEMTVSIGENPDVNLKLSHTGPSPEAKAKQDLLQKTFDDGVAASKAGNNDEAIAKFTEAAGMAPNCADCYYNIGVANVQKQNLPGAEEAYKKAIELKPDHCDALANLANVYNAEKKLDLALEMTSKAGQCGGGAAAGAAGGGGGGNPTSLYNEGVILWNQGKYPEAKAKFEASAKMDPGNAETQYRLGMANINIGDMAGATAAFEACLKAAPNGPHAAEVKGFLAAMKK